MKRSYDEAYDLSPSTRCVRHRLGTAESQNIRSTDLPNELLEQILKYIIPVDEAREVIYGPAPRWKLIQPLMHSFRRLSDCTTDLVYGVGAPFVFSKNAGDTLPLFLLSLRRETAGKIKAVRIKNPGGDALDVGLDLLLKCKSLKSLQIEGSPLVPKLYPSLRCLRLEVFEIPTSNKRVLPPRLETIKADILSKKPLKAQQQARTQEDTPTKVNLKHAL